MVGGEEGVRCGLWRWAALRSRSRLWRVRRVSSQSLARLGGQTIGIDASESNIAIARLHASKDPFLPLLNHEEDTASRIDLGAGSLEYRHTSAEDLRATGENFDVVCAMEVLEHVDEPGAFLACLGDLVKVNGIHEYQSPAQVFHRVGMSWR